MHERQAILSTTVVISHTFCMENKNELTPEGRGNNYVMLRSRDLEMALASNSCSEHLQEL